MTSLTLVRRIKARPQIVFDAVTTAEGIVHWWGPDAGPVLVAVGERDVPGFREMSAVLARRIPGAIYRVVADAGHMINMEQPAAVNELLTRFMLQDASWNW